MPNIGNNSTIIVLPRNLSTGYVVFGYSLNEPYISANKKNTRGKDPHKLELL